MVTEIVVTVIVALVLVAFWLIVWRIWRKQVRERRSAVETPEAVTSPRRILEQIHEAAPGRVVIAYDGDEMLATWTNNADQTVFGRGLNTRAACLALARELGVHLRNV